MRTVNIPRTKLDVSVIGLGTGSFGTRVSRDDSFRILDLFVELGGNFVDTAHIYAAWVPGGGGASERLIGEWLESRGLRNQMIIGTKGGHPDLESMHISRMSPGEIAQDMQESLERLRIATIDLYWLHRDDPAHPVDELIGTLNDAVNANRIRYFGFSNWSTQRMTDALEYANQQNVTGFVANQPGWSLAVRNPDVGDSTMVFMDAEMHEFHRRTGLMAVPYSSQANGFFAGGYGRDIHDPKPRAGQGVVRAYYNETNFDRLDRGRELASRLGCKPNDVALAYLLHQPFPTSALVGCGTEAHLRESCKGADVTLSQEDIRWLED